MKQLIEQMIARSVCRSEWTLTIFTPCSIAIVDESLQIREQWWRQLFGIGFSKTALGNDMLGFGLTVKALFTSIMVVNS